MADELVEELAQARSVGFVPVRIGEEAFEAAANSGTMKYVVLRNGDVILSRKVIDGVEIKHSVLANGQAVSAAGEVEISVVGGQRFGVEINRLSGHYQPDPRSLEIAREAFSRQGILFP